MQELLVARSVYCLGAATYQQLVEKLAKSFLHPQGLVPNSEVLGTTVFVPVALAKQVEEAEA